MSKDNGSTAEAAKIRLNRLENMVDNALMSRQELIKTFLDPRRDIGDECGYPKTDSITSNEYGALYSREAVATRVVQVLPQESWQVQPTVFETEDIGQVTPFEEAWAELDESVRGKSWYQDEEGSPIWEYLKRADELSGIGSYGVLLLGVGDGKDLSEPIDRVLERRDSGKESSQQLLFLRAFDETLAQITGYESGITNPRFGQPVTYSITLNDSSSESGIGLSTATKTVHWTRVIHVADNLGSSEIFGVPRMKPVYNRLLDLRKLYSGSAEMYWRGAFPGLSIETHPHLGSAEDVELNTAMKGELENYMNGLQRYMALTGMSAKSLAPQVVDPTPQINVQIEAICIRLGIPKRVFTGSERGELASSQDKRTWNARLRLRQSNYITPRIIIPFVDRLIRIGVLPEPEGYSVVWPDLDSLTPEETAVIAERRTNALTKYVQGGVEALVPPLDYLTRIIGLPSKEAEAIIEEAMGVLEDESSN